MVKISIPVCFIVLFVLCTNKELSTVKILSEMYPDFPIEELLVAFKDPVINTSLEDVK